MISVHNLIFYLFKIPGRLRQTTLPPQVAFSVLKIKFCTSLPAEVTRTAFPVYFSYLELLVVQFLLLSVTYHLLDPCTFLRILFLKAVSFFLPVKDKVSHRRKAG
jgi:hypothetical protein